MASKELFNIAGMPIADQNVKLGELVQKQVNLFFGKEIKCSERLIETFQFQTSDMSIIPPYGLWMSAIKYYPQMTDFLTKIGFRFDSIKWNDWPQVNKNDYAVQDWYTSVGQMFNFFLDSEYSKLIPHSDDCLSLFNKVKDRGSLSIFDCLISSIRDRRIDHFNSAIELLYRGTHLGKTITVEGGERFWEKNSKYYLWANDISFQMEEWLLKDEISDDNYFVIYYEADRLRIRPFAKFITGQIENNHVEKPATWLGRGNVFENYNSHLENGLLLLEDLIRRKAKESEFQKFFEQYPKFLLLLGNYKKIHPQLILTEDNGSKLIPDFFLEKIDTDYCDILDLKRPTAELARLQKNRNRFRDCVMEAVAQLEHYRDWFDEKSHREAFNKKYKINSFRPQAVIVIGRRENYIDEVTRIKFDAKLPKWVTLTTYDDIFDRVRQWKNFTSGF